MTITLSIFSYSQDGNRLLAMIFLMTMLIITISALYFVSLMTYCYEVKTFQAVHQVVHQVVITIPSALLIKITRVL